MKTLLKIFEENKNKKEAILDNIVKTIKNCNVIDDVEISFSNISNRNAKLNVEIKLNCAWTHTARLEIYKNKTHKFSTSAGGIDNEENYLEELHILTGYLLDFIRNFNYDVFNQLENLEKEITQTRKEIEKAEYNKKLENLKKDLVEVNIDDLIERAEKGEVVEFYTIEGLSLEKNILYKENRRFKLNRRVIAKNKIKDIIKVAYEKNYDKLYIHINMDKIKE